MDLAGVRRRWQEPGTGDALVTVGLLASYTIDPLRPYLGVALHDAGLPVSFRTGPFNQIVQQCLDDTSVMAVERPDVLVVAPRFEELGDELVSVVDAAVAAARRWGSFLVVVLPAVPEERVFGYLDDGRATGTAAAAYEAREAVRALVADRPDAWVVDAEQAVRFVGTGKAHHAAMFKFAKIPYTEAVFAELAAQVAGVLRAVYGLTPRVVVVDEESAAALAEPVRRLRESGARVETAAREVPAESVVRLAVDNCPADLLRSGLLDRLPPPEVVPLRAQRSARAVSLADFVAGLNVEVEIERDSFAKVVEVVSRAKDFTLGTETLDLSEDREVFAVRVRDRFGDYGISGAVGIRSGVVDVFSLSCTVLGKGVQDIVLRKLIADHGDLAFRYRRTPHNQITAGFLADAGAVVEEIS